MINMPKQLERKLIEDYLIEELQKRGWSFVATENLGRETITEPLLLDKVREAILKLNEDLEISEEEVNKVISELRLLGSGQGGQQQILHYFKYGVPVKFEKDRIVKTVQLFDFEEPENNRFIISRQVTFKGQELIRTDIILFVNGVPLVNIECKSPVGSAVSWRDSFKQIKNYEQLVPELYKYLQIGVAVGTKAKYFPIVPWQDEVNIYEWKEENKDSIGSILEFLSPEKFLDVLRNFLFFREESGEATKVVARYMQYRAANKIVERVLKNLEGKEDKNKGLVWHWQGSGKTLTMIFAGHKLYFASKLENPTLFFIVDRIDLETQLFDEFNSLKLNFSPEVVSSIKELKGVVQADNFRGKRGAFVVLIHKFRPEELKEINKMLAEQEEAQSTISQRRNVVVFLDEVHRTQYGIMAAQMKKILKNAFFFGFTGTPIAEDERNTYETFGYPLKQESYLDRYFVDDSLRDGFTVKIVYQPRLDELHLKKELLDAFLEIAFEDLEEAEKEGLEAKVSKRIDKIRLFLEDPGRIEEIARDIGAHFKENLDNKFKAMVVTGSRKACVLYKKALDKILPPEYSEVVMTYTLDDEEVINNFHREWSGRFPGLDDNTIRKRIKENFREEGLPKILIVTDMLLTGFDAPVLQTMYLDKPLKKHRLLQAIARTNRPFKGVKEAGLIIDYVGVLREIKRAFKAYYKEPEIKNILASYDTLVEEFVSLLQDLGEIFTGISRSYERDSLFKAFERIQQDEAVEKEFLEKYWALRRVFEMLGAHEIKVDYLEEFKWYSSLYTYYLRVKNQREEDSEKVKKYLKRTLSFIHRSTEIEKLNKDLPLFAFDETYLKKIKEAKLSEREKAANMIFTLERLVLVEQKRDPIYRSLADKVENLIKIWQQKAKDYETVYQAGLKILETIEQEKEKRVSLGFSLLDHGVFLALEAWVPSESERTDYTRRLRGRLIKFMVPGWIEQPALRKNIEQELRVFLRKNLKSRYQLRIEDLDKVYMDVWEVLQNYET